MTEANFHNRFLLVYFGFTHCKVVCPRSLAKLSRVLDRGDRDARTVAAVYITVDPERDTPEVMRCYLAKQHPRFTGLTGSREQIDEAKRNFRIFAARRDAATGPNYDVPHTALAYLVDPAEPTGRISPKRRTRMRSSCA